MKTGIRFAVMLGAVITIPLSQVSAKPAISESADAQRYLRARQAEQTGNHCAATDELAKPFNDIPAAVAQSTRHRWARNAVLCGRCQQAQPLLTSLLVHGKRVDADKAYDRWLLAGCDLQRGAFAKASSGLRKLLRKPSKRIDVMTVYLQRIHALIMLGDFDRAQDEFMRVLIELPGHELETRLLDLMKTDLSILNGKQHLQRIEKLYDNRQYQKALDEIKTLSIPKDRSLRAKYLHLHGMILFRLRNHYQESARVLAQAAKIKSPYQMKDAFHAARALSRADKDPQAVVAYRRFAKRYAGHPQSIQALYLAAWLEMRMGKTSSAERAMSNLLKNRKLRAVVERDVLPQLGFAALDDGRYLQAAEHFEEYRGLVRHAMDIAKTYYWQARALELAGDKKDAEALYRYAIGADPLHWYALLATQRLAALGVVLPTPFAWHSVDGQSVPDAKQAPAVPGDMPDLSEKDHAALLASMPEEARFFTELGLREYAVQALAAHKPESNDHDGQKTWLAWHQAIDALNVSYRQAMRWNRDEHHRKGINDDNAWWWHAAYPMPYRSLVEEAALKSKVDSAYLYATMRQESAYDKAAISRANAIGLLQLLLSTAQRVGKEAKITENITESMLFEPKWNVLLGSLEMADLMKRFDHQLVLTLAAYNAGSARAERWLREAKHLETDRFVEAIPFRETYNYVRRVTGHYARYRYLQDPQAKAYQVPMMLKRP